MGSWPKGAESASGHGVRSNFLTSTGRTSRKCRSHQSHMQTTLAQASTAWNVNLIFQLINMINQNKLPEPACRRAQAAEKGGTDPAGKEENQETPNLQTSVPLSLTGFNTLPSYLLLPQRMSPQCPGHSLEFRDCSELRHSPLQLAGAALQP